MMTKRWMRQGALTATAAAVVLAACSEQTSPTALELDPAFEISNLDYTPIQTPDQQGFRCTFTSDAEGGTADCGPHSLQVPAGVVPAGELADFEVEVLAGDEVRVELFATTRTSSVHNDLGAAGFSRSVDLTLTYGSGYENRYPEDEFVIVWVKPDGTMEAVPSVVDTTQNRITGSLDHFSEYAIAVP